MKTITDLCMEITRQEAGKKQVSIAQIREIIKIVSLIYFLDQDKISKMFLQNGKRHYIKGLKRDIKR